MIEAEQNGVGPGDAGVAKATTLADLLKERGALLEPELLTIFLQVLGDLESAHRQGMLHRDISPERITLVGANWKLTDYGSSKVGTVWYMSPERCQGQSLDARSDIYSLGVALYEAATGRLPFDAEMKFQVMEAHLNTAPPPPRAIKEAVSPELEQVILRALSKDPDDRFQSAAEFKGALEQLPGASDASPTPVAQPANEPAVEPAAGPAESLPVDVQPAARRVKPVAILVPLAVVIAAAAVLFFTGVIGPRRVPLVTGIGAAEAQEVLLGKRFRVETDTVDETLAAGTVVTQEPVAGEWVARSRAVTLTVSTGMVAVPDLAGMTLDDARAQLARLALTEVKVDSPYSDRDSIGIVLSSKPDAGAKLAPHSPVGLTVCGGRATCPDCGARRQAGAQFCTTCGYRF
jgi:hypothetical protein